MYALCWLYILFVPLVERYSNRKPSNWYAAYIEQVRFGGLAQFDVLFASS